MKSIPDKSVDMVLTDPPYGTTACKWDTVIPFEPLWKHYKRVIKRNGAIVLTASQPFTSALVMSRPDWFRYSWVWNKNNQAGFATVAFRPFIVCEDADFERARDAALVMIFSINGERCTAGSRILVQSSLYPEFARRFVERAKRITVGDPLDPTTVIGPMVSQGHLARVRGYIELGLQEGATLLCGGIERPDYAPEVAAAVRDGNFVWPTVFADVRPGMRIMREEIFGPVACLLPFSDEADAIAQANDNPYGLASYVWSENAGRAHRVAAALEAGVCYVNSQSARDPRPPFGGVKDSGYGSEGGPEALEAYLNSKTVSIFNA